MDPGWLDPLLRPDLANTGAEVLLSRGTYPLQFMAAVAKLILSDEVYQHNRLACPLGLQHPFQTSCYSPAPDQASDDLQAWGEPISN